MDTSAYQVLVVRTTLEVASSVPIELAHCINERHLHHAFSHHLQQRRLSLGFDGEPAHLHPEWPTWKESVDRRFIRYRQRDGREFHPDETGSPGFVDFAIGEYEKPTIGVELFLGHAWNHERITYDLMKLIDPELCFDLGVLLVMVLRPGRRIPTSLDKRLDRAYQAAKERVQLARGKLCKHSLFVLVAEVLAEREPALWHLSADGTVCSGPPQLEAA